MVTDVGGQVWGHNLLNLCGAIYTLARVKRIQSTCHLQHLYLAMLPIWRRSFHYGVDRFSLTNTALYYLNAWDRLWKGRLKQFMISFPASREKIFRYSFQYRFRFASRPMRRNSWYFNSFLAHGWRRGSRMALDHSLSLIYSLNLD